MPFPLRVAICLLGRIGSRHILRRIENYGRQRGFDYRKSLRHAG